MAPIQLAMRLLLPAGSTLLALPEMRPYLQGFDASALTYRWVHPDARVDQLCDEALKLVQSGEAETASGTRFSHACGLRRTRPLVCLL